VKGRKLLPYWLLFAFFAAGALLVPGGRRIAYQGQQITTAEPGRTPFRLFYLIGAIATIAMIGLRYRVGADWWNYLSMLRSVHDISLASAMRRGDPGYQFLNWMVINSGGDIWMVNLAAAAVFCWGLYRLCSIQPSPWLAFAIAIPYLVVVVAMGYTRQSMALGVLMAGLARQTRGASIVNFALYVAGAALFHKTAVIVFPIVAISSRGSKLVNFLILIFTSYFLYNYFLSDTMDVLVENYLDRGYDSQGAGVRIAMNMVPAILFWIFRGKLGFDEMEFKIWRNFALASVAFAFLLFVLSSSTAVDRMALYMMPLQIPILTRVALLGESRIPGTTAVLAYLFSVQFVWLNFAAHATYWVPYMLYPF
jgi:hypothetical protein